MTMTRWMPKTSRLPYDGGIDADGHILEPPTIWEDYIDPKYRDRAVRVAVADNGKEYFQVDGRAKKKAEGLGNTGSMGRSEKEIKDLSYVEAAPFGTMDAAERVELLEMENLAGAVVYPTEGLNWPYRMRNDPELTAAHCVAYNRWIADFCRDHSERLVPIAHLDLTDVAGAVAEFERAVKDGCRGAFVAPFTLTSKSHGHPDHDPLWAKAEELDVPMSIHPMLEPREITTGNRFKDLSTKDANWYYNVLARQGMQQALYSFFQYGVFDKFPRFKLIILEAGAGWIGASLDRMDAVFEAMSSTRDKQVLPLKEKPSTYFKRQCWISADPDERALAGIIEHVGADRFFWASDYPHGDHPPTYIDDLAELAGMLPEHARGILGDNVRACYGL